MYKEVELKFIIANKDEEKVFEKLALLGHQISRPRTYELSVMYDNPAGLMQKTDGRIRLRQSGDRIEFAYKKPITREGVKQEIEYEVEVSALEPLQKILKEMEFVPTTSYERYRTEFCKDKLKITLDEYPFSTFLEIEGDEDGIIKVASDLGFDLANNLTDSCDTLFTKWRVARGLSPISHMRFDDHQR